MYSNKQSENLHYGGQSGSQHYLRNYQAHRRKHRLYIDAGGEGTDTGEGVGARVGSRRRLERARENGRRNVRGIQVQDENDLSIYCNSQ